MGKLILEIQISLDGFVADREGRTPLKFIKSTAFSCGMVVNHLEKDTSL